MFFFIVANVFPGVYDTVIHYFHDLTHAKEKKSIN